MDWRGGALPKEPKRLRPAVVVEEHDLFADAYPNMIVVPLTSDEGLAIPGLSVTIEPDAENGCRNRCFALSQSVTTVSTRRVTATASRIQAAILADIRARIAMAIGFG